jgi:hypothetical protein
MICVCFCQNPYRRALRRSHTIMPLGCFCTANATVKNAGQQLTEARFMPDHVNTRHEKWLIAFCALK